MEKSQAPIEEQEWLAQRKKIVGASEISAIVRHTISEDELEKAMGKQSKESYLSESDFATAYELYHLKKGTLESKTFPPILSEFGHKMELYANNWLNSFEFIKSECQPQEVLKSDLHELAGYTPDVFCEFTNDMFFKSKDCKKGDKAVVEVKTINYFKTKSEKVEDAGLPFQYIMQGQYQLMQENSKDSNYKWLIMCWITPQEHRFDNDFYKGKAVGYIDCGEFDKVSEFFDIHCDVYKVYKTLHPMFITSLDRWKNILENNIEPTPNFARDGEIVSGVLKDSMPEIISYCEVKYGIKDGYIPLNLLENCDSNLYDSVKIYHEKCSEFSTLKKEIEEEKTKYKDMFLRAKILGLDDERFSLKVCKAGSGLTIKCSFKNKYEIETGAVATEKF